MAIYSKWYREFDSYRNITANVILMLYQVDGTELLMEAAKTSDQLFLQLGYLIFTNHLTALASEFENNFGNNWSKKYKQLLEQRYHQLYALVEI